MRLDIAIAQSFVAWGRPIVRGELPADGFDRFAAERGWARHCVIETPEARFEDAAAWLGSLRTAGRLPALGPDLCVESRGPEDALTFLPTLTNAPPGPNGKAQFDVTFRSGATRKLDPAGEVALEPAALALEKVLESLIALGKRADLGGWLTNFEGTLAELHSGPEADWLAVPLTAPPRARALAVAATRADVFGGMGSWNDFWLEDSALEHERSVCSSALYVAMRDAVRASANAC